ncbi:hypothetical protein NQ317_010674 [Molorchus minor]|uniref:Uncharacterized protein n=1 Tax=Molorchus minor TaxID=1323400 RepID=A0ABQ9K7A2_9CUCU|nr:hypothetical protein NQ317_010674 [Molorchus minor]
MTERVINRRKSQLFLTNISPVTNTYDELIKEKLEMGKFPTTKTGILKIIGMEPIAYFGLTAKRAALWIYLDIVLNFIFSLNSIICSVITFKECSDKGSLTKISGPSGMAGAVVIIISCGAIFLMYRYIEYDDDTPPPSSRQAKRSGSIYEA